MSTAKELYIKLKAFFDAPPVPPATPAVPAPPAPLGVLYTLNDGSQISIVQAGDTPAPGDMATIAGAPAPANTYTLQDGSTLTADATGTVTAYTAGTPVTVDPLDAGKTPPAAAPPAVPAAPAPPKQFELTQASMAAMFASFATGTPEDRIANLELVCKALMDSCFGWQIREAQQKANTDQAILIYKQDLVNAQAAALAKQDEKITGMFEIMEKLVEVPTADPVTLTGRKKEQFDASKKKEDRFEQIAADMKRFKTAK